MKKRNPQAWIVRFKVGKHRPETIITPMFVFPWECLLWIRRLKPTAEVISIEPYRASAVVK